MATMATRTVQPRTKTYEQNDILTNMMIKGDSKADAAIVKATQKLKDIYCYFQYLNNINSIMNPAAAYLLSGYTITSNADIQTE